MNKTFNHKYVRASSRSVLDEFITTLGDINDRLQELQSHADDHMGYDPDNINWAHVGTAQHFLKELTELTDLAYGRGEYAE